MKNFVILLLSGVHFKSTDGPCHNTHVAAQFMTWHTMVTQLVCSTFITYYHPILLVPLCIGKRRCGFTA